MIARARVCIEGEALDAYLAAAYLAGAGVGVIEANEVIASRCRAINDEIDVVEINRTGNLAVTLELDGRRRRFEPEGDDLVARGAGVARAVLMAVLGSDR